MTTTWEITKMKLNAHNNLRQTLTNSTQRINHSFTALLIMLFKLSGTIFGKHYHLG